MTTNNNTVFQKWPKLHPCLPEVAHMVLGYYNYGKNVGYLGHMCKQINAIALGLKVMIGWVQVTTW